MNILQYRGEYGTEFTTFIPYVHFLKTKGLLKHKILTYKGMRPYYYFLEDEEILFMDEQRTHVPTKERFFVPEDIRDDDTYIMDLKLPEKFLPPPYRDFFKMFPLECNKPIVLVFNKYNPEWGTSLPPMNYFDLNELAMIGSIFNDSLIVYFRTTNYTGNDYAKDHDELDNSILYDYNDKMFLKNNFPNVVLIEELMENYKGVYEFNTLKGCLLANASLSISTLTGSTHFNMYFPCRHIVYSKLASYPFNTSTFYNHLHKIMSNNRDAKIDYVTSTETFFKTCIEIAKTIGQNSPFHAYSYLHSVMEKTT